jgi:hypothetical protein
MRSMHRPFPAGEYDSTGRKDFSIRLLSFATERWLLFVPESQSLVESSMGAIGTRRQNDSS